MIQPLKVVHVVPHINEEASGPSYSVPRLCQSIAQTGADVELMCLAAKDEISGVRTSIYTQWNVLNRFAISSSMLPAMRQRSATVDIVHNHSLWSMPNVAAGFVVPSRRAKLVTSPRGTLSPWALKRSKWMKKIMWPLQRKALFDADLLHATSEQEILDMRALGLSQPIAFIPNGVDIPARVESLRTKMSSHRTLLFLGRLHPVKGIDLLLDAWRRLQKKHSDWRLQIVGKGELAYVNALQKRALDMALQRVHFCEPAYGTTKSEIYWNAELFVLPSYSENFGMAVAEALAHGLPAIVTHGAPWHNLQTHDCGWWIETSVDALTEALEIAMSANKETLAAKGAHGQQWMRQDFGWHAAGIQMTDAYHWILEGGATPACVRNIN
jgi:glycosyltransferase involved in cell wall biosynthesis